MISVDRLVKPALQKSYIARNGGSAARFHDFAPSQGAVGKSKTAIEVSWLTAKGGTGKNANELWGSYLATKGFTIGTLGDRMRSFFATGTQA